MKQKMFKLVFLFSLFFVACSTNRVWLVNETEKNIDSLHLFAGSEEIWSGELKSGKKKKISFSIRKDSSFSVLEELPDGSIYRIEGLGYLTPNDGQKHEIVIQKDRKIFYR